MRQEALANGLDFHLAAILWRNKTPISICINSTKTNPHFKRTFAMGKPTSYCTHAEAGVCLRAQPGDYLEVYRWTKGGRLSMSKPCKWCRLAIKKAGIKQVTFTDWSGNKQIVKTKNL